MNASEITIAASERSLTMLPDRNIVSYRQSVFPRRYVNAKKRKNEKTVPKTVGTRTTYRSERMPNTGPAISA